MNTSNYWRPSATIQVIKQRANMLNIIREFMLDNSVLEVETPVLSQTTVTDPFIDSIEVNMEMPIQGNNTTFFMQTSPEYAMKRLLAYGVGAIYQITRAFRNNELGKLHNPEFSLLEWYQININHFEMINEIERLLRLLGFNDCIRISYEDIFEQQTGLNPHSICTKDLYDYAKKQGLVSKTEDKAFLLDFIFSEEIVPILDKDKPVFIYDYPEHLSALAKLSNDNPVRAERFELFINGIEIANGFNELCDAGQQLQRFEQNKIKRNLADKPDYAIDHRLLAALEHGLPPCSGVAIGLDRLLMQIVKCENIKQVLTFPVEIA